MSVETASVLARCCLMERWVANVLLFRVAQAQQSPAGGPTGPTPYRGVGLGPPPITVHIFKI
eukprot:4777807-Karenia_brevis.AAC.1